MVSKEEGKKAKGRKEGTSRKLPTKKAFLQGALLHHLGERKTKANRTPLLNSRIIVSLGFRGGFLELG